MNRHSLPESQLPRLLSRSLTPAEAPDALWSAVAARIEKTPPHAVRWRGLAMAAAIAALMTGGVLYLRAQQPRAITPEQVALRLHTSGQADAAMTAYTVRREFTASGAPVTSAFTATTSPASGA